MPFFPQGPARGTPKVRPHFPVLAIGRRAYVACPGGRRARATLTDDTGVDSPASLAAGTEVDIIAWRPRGSRETLYRVRSTGDGLEGWLRVANLQSKQSSVGKQSAVSKQSTVQ